MIELPIFSPVEVIPDPLFEEKGISVSIKRDDMIHPFISGNKWRKLKYVLRDAEAGQRHHLVTFGGAFSNHLLATACAAAKFGFRSTGFVRGERVENAHLKICDLFGMKLRFVDRTSYRDKRGLYEQNYHFDEDSYFIDEGGAGDLAAEGCSELIGELTEPYDHIFCAAGTGTTVAGLIRGCERAGLKTLVHAVPVLKGDGYLREEIGKLEDGRFELHENYHFGGYAKSDSELIGFIRKFSSDHGILLDQVYTAKMMYAIYDMVRRDSFPTGTSILAIHTGGLLGITGLK